MKIKEQNVAVVTKMQKYDAHNKSGWWMKGSNTVSH